MPTFADALANVLTVSALVAIFLTLRRNNRTPRFQLWLLGWLVMWMHFALMLVPEMQGVAESLISSAQFATLGLAGLCFLVSVTYAVDIRRWRHGLMTTFGALIIVFSLILGFEWNVRLLTLGLGLIMYGLSIASFLAWHRRPTRYVSAMAVLLISFGALGLYRVARADYEGGYYALLLSIYTICAVLTLRTFRDWTAGVIVTVSGFVAWSAVWAVAVFVPQWVLSVGPTNDIFNFPKLLVAFGMVMTELESRSLLASSAQKRERLLGQQLARFAEVTTRLLEGAEVNAICDEIAQCITEIGNFQRCAIILTDDAGRMYVAGMSGLDPKAVVALRDAVSHSTIEDVQKTVARSRPLGKNSFYTPSEVMATVPAVRTTQIFDENSSWQAGDEVLVPLRSAAGNYVGTISLDDPKDPERVVAEEMYAIEMLAGHLGVAIEKASLQRKFVVREKLASIGQLVGGVAHELNNPLTVIIGYSDLLSESDTEKRYERELTTMRREARRMRSIIDNLLRFARQSRTETQSANLVQAIEESLAIRNYEITRRGIEIERDLAQDLPPVNIDESQLKTVIVNLLNNSFDAVQDVEDKKVSIYSRRVADKVLFSVIDSGPGFTDVTRAFDPFFSTKGVGRGSGLGLSICYGIVKQHGGDIYAQNVKPSGACVTMELRLAVASTPATTAEQPAVSH